MRRNLRVAIPLTAAAVGLAAVAYAHPALAKRMVPFRRAFARFAMLGKPIGGDKAAPAAPAFLTSSRIAALSDGALVIDEDSGELIRADVQGKPLAKLPIGRQAGLLAYDPHTKRAFVADRVSNRLAIVEVGNDLSVVRSIATPVEPYGVALTPDRSTVLVT